ncbi:hypothetical protein QBC39DRAFT_177167 [Podospora conica]|nr:hypothetical protein QBC39DRAFT_177167 [Schizothecium conicum]
MSLALSTTRRRAGDIHLFADAWASSSLSRFDDASRVRHLHRRRRRHQFQLVSRALRATRRWPRRVSSTFGLGASDSISIRLPTTTCHDGRPTSARSPLDALDKRVHSRGVIPDSGGEAEMARVKAHATKHTYKQEGKDLGAQQGHMRRWQDASRLWHAFRQPSSVQSLQLRLPRRVLSALPSPPSLPSRASPTCRLLCAQLQGRPAITPSRVSVTPSPRCRRRPVAPSPSSVAPPLFFLVFLPPLEFHDPRSPTMTRLRPDDLFRTLPDSRGVELFACSVSPSSPWLVAVCRVLAL